MNGISLRQWEHCEKKIPFNTEKEAKKKLKHRKKLGFLVEPTVRIFKCDFCGYYHIGRKKED